jgi:hypothetical protein
MLKIFTRDGVRFCGCFHNRFYDIVCADVLCLSPEITAFAFMFVGGLEVILVRSWRIRDLKRMNIAMTMTIMFIVIIIKLCL